MCGARFEDGGIPLQVLSDLSALREMVVEVAKGRYLAENPNRQRAPRGFADKIDLTLTGIDNGSAMPIINFTTTETETLLPGISPRYLDCLLWAKDAIARSVAAASGNGHTLLIKQSLNDFWRILIGLDVACTRANQLNSPCPTARLRLN